MSDLPSSSSYVLWSESVTDPSGQRGHLLGLGQPGVENKSWVRNTLGIFLRMRVYHSVIAGELSS